MALALMGAATRWELPARILGAWPATQASAARSPWSKKHHAAFHKYSRTWMKFMATVTSTWRRRASAKDGRDLLGIAIDQRHPRAVDGWDHGGWPGRRWRRFTASMLSTTLAISHFPRAIGPGLAGDARPSFPLGLVMMSSGVRGAGLQS